MTRPGRPGECYGKIIGKEGLHLRHGWGHLSRQPPATRGPGVCGMAVPGEEGVFIPHQQQRQNPAGASAEAGEDGAGHRRKAFLHQRLVLNSYLNNTCQQTD